MIVQLISKLTKNPSQHLQAHLKIDLRSHHSPRKQHLGKTLLKDVAIVVSQSRQQYIFNDKRETELTKLIEELT